MRVIRHEMCACSGENKRIYLNVYQDEKINILISLIKRIMEYLSCLYLAVSKTFYLNLTFSLTNKGTSSSVGMSVGLFIIKCRLLFI